MQVIPAKHIGFCFGVKRAISLAREAASQGTVYDPQWGCDRQAGARGHSCGKDPGRNPPRGNGGDPIPWPFPQRPDGFGKPSRQGAGRDLSLCIPDPSNRSGTGRSRPDDLALWSGKPSRGAGDRRLWGKKPGIYPGGDRGCPGAALYGKGLLGVSDHSQGVGFPDGGRNIAGKNKGSESI